MPDRPASDFGKLIAGLFAVPGPALGAVRPAHPEWPRHDHAERFGSRCPRGCPFIGYAEAVLGRPI